MRFAKSSDRGGPMPDPREDTETLISAVPSEIVPSKEECQCRSQNLPSMTDLTAWTDCCFMPATGVQIVEAFISRQVMHRWVDPIEPNDGRRSLLRAQYNAFSKFNLAAIERIVVSKYQRGAAFNRQHPFVDVLLSDITESKEVLDTSKLVREARPPSFQRISR
jgi:hypothetical protein